mmetsp:Transcript_9396/g.23036  ORF Transcript_9396/g.23036 Transcript_9396/m.23036 type:complete len:356 (-) Transcript_9396:70-1137(-)
MVALARLASVITPQARGAAPRTLLSAVGAHSQAFLARAPAPAHAAASARAQLQAGAGVAAGRAGVAWTTLRDGVHRRPFATAAAAPFVADAAALQPPVVPLPGIVANLAEEMRRRQKVATTYFKQPVLSFTTMEPVGEMDLATAVFKQEVRTDIMHRVVLWQRAKRRMPSQQVKTRMMVSGGGKKPWGQKGSGRARHGSIRSPIWKGGGKAHGPVARSFAFKVNKKVRRLGLRCAISARFREGMFTVIDSEAIGENKTKVAAALKKQWGWPDTLVITGAEVEANFKRAAANIHSFDILPAPGANVEMILKRKKLVVTKEAVELLHKHLLRHYTPEESNTRLVFAALSAKKAHGFQ